jgi:hypothetical protein
MAVAVKISDELISDARVHSKVNHRSITRQIEYWAKIGKCAEDNPDLTFDQVRQILLGIEELSSGHGKPYRFG